MNLIQGNLENLILNALWNLEDNNKALNDVSDVLNFINSNDRQWAYTTVKTALDRLSEKNYVIRYKQGKKYFYKAKISRKKAGEEAIKKLASQYYNNDLIELLKAVERAHNDLILYAK